MLGAVHKSASLRAAAVLGLGGLAFTLANLIFARILPTREYGLVSLVIGIVAVAGLAAPLGLDLVVARRGLLLDAPWRRAVLGSSCVVGIASAAVSSIGYQLTLPLLLCVLIITVTSGLMQASAAQLQGLQRFGAAAWIVQLPNWAFLLAALLSALLGFETAVAACAAMTMTSAIGGVIVWMVATEKTTGRGKTAVVAAEGAPARSNTGQPQPAPRTVLGEAFSLVTNHVANSVFLQLERLVLAPIAGVQALALFGVVAALVASPFRMLQMAVLFTLIPNLRRANTTEERRRLLRREVLLIAGVIAVGSGLIWIIAPPVAHVFLSGRYELSAPLMSAALVAGVLKLTSAFATGTVIALAEEKGLRTLSVVSWATIVLSCIAALAAAPWGLVGVLYGISAGWLVRSLIAGYMAIPYVRRPVGPLREAPFGDQSQMPRAPR